MDTTIILVDDHPIIREGLRSLFETEPDYQILGEANNGFEACQLVDQLKPDILLLDWVMPGMNGLSVLMQVRQTSPKTRVIIISMHSNEAYVLQALRNGAMGYILKDSLPTEVMHAIREVTEGRRFLSPPLSEVLIEGYLHKTEATEMDSYDTLTLREREVLNFVVGGHSNTEIATWLSISPRTVEVHRANLMHKLGMHNQGELFRYALKRGLITVEENMY